MSSPLALVERLFDRFIGAFGAQKFGAMWDGVEERESVMHMWADQLSRFHQQTVGAALQSVIDSGREWPPTLPEFVALCRDAAITRSNAVGITYQPTPTPRDVAQENLARIREMLSRIGEAGRADPLHWARHPKSVKAVELMLRGAERDNRLREIVRGHVEDAGDRLPNDDAVRLFTAALERDHSLLTAENETPTR